MAIEEGRTVEQILTTLPDEVRIAGELFATTYKRFLVYGNVLKSGDGMHIVGMDSEKTLKLISRGVGSHFETLIDSGFSQEAQAIQAIIKKNWEEYQASLKAV